MKKTQSLGAMALLASLSLTAGLLLACNQTGGEEANKGPQTERTSAPASTAPPAETKPASADGESLFKQSCASCHGQDGKGIPSLGKDLVGSAFVKGLQDPELVAFIIKGRDASDPANTTKIPMPPKGGNPSLDEPQIQAIVAYMRTLK